MPWRMPMRGKSPNARRKRIIALNDRELPSRLVCLDQTRPERNPILRPTGRLVRLKNEVHFTSWHAQDRVGKRPLSAIGQAAHMIGSKMSDADFVDLLGL